MRKLRILVVSEGPRNFWHQVAIGFHKVGCHVSYVFLRPGLANELAAIGAAYDVVVTNQAGINSFAIAMRDTASIDWRRHFPQLVMVQFHDISREIPTLTQAPQIFGPRSVRLAYHVSCAKTFRFLEKLGVVSDYFLAPLPISIDHALDITEEASDSCVDDVGTQLQPTTSKLNGAPVVAFCPKIIYLGEYYFDNVLPLRPDSPFNGITTFLNAVAEYREQGHPFDKLGFFEYFHAKGVLSPAHFVSGVACEYAYGYGGTVILPNRRDYVALVKRHFGEGFHLYGDWQKFGIDCIPGERAADDSKYRNAFISVDFGSTFVDTSIYQRSMQILASGGRLLQLRQADADAAFGEFADLVCFDGPDDLLTKLSGAMTAPREYLLRQAAFADFVRVRHDPATVSRSTLRHLGLDEPR